MDVLSPPSPPWFFQAPFWVTRIHQKKELRPRLFNWNVRELLKDWVWKLHFQTRPLAISPSRVRGNSCREREWASMAELAQRGDAPGKGGNQACPCKPAQWIGHFFSPDHLCCPSQAFGQMGTALHQRTQGNKRKSAIIPAFEGLCLPAVHMK